MRIIQLYRPNIERYLGGFLYKNINYFKQKLNTLPATNTTDGMRKNRVLPDSRLQRVNRPVAKANGGFCFKHKN